MISDSRCVNILLLVCNQFNSLSQAMIGSLSWQAKLPHQLDWFG